MVSRSPHEVATRRSLGAYYTPEPYARLLVRWALAGEVGRIIDPSYGGCAVLRVAVEELRHLGAEDPAAMIYGADIDHTTAQWAAHLVSQGVPESHLVHADFLSLEPGVDLPMVEAVVGNPPYVRHHWISPAVKARARVVSDAAPVPVDRRASLWAAFAVHSARFVRPGGRMALLLPGAVLHADYAESVRASLCQLFGEVVFVRLRERIFHEAAEETVVLMASGAGSVAGHFKVEAAMELNELGELTSRSQSPRTPRTPRHLDAIPQWKLDLLPAEGMQLLEEIRRDPRIKQLGQIATVRIGTVTGANAFFVRTPAEVERLGIERYVTPVVARNAWLTAPELTQQHFRRATGNHPSRLVVLPPKLEIDKRTRLGRAIKAAEAAGVDARRKCDRDPWWALQSVARPRMFLPYMSGNPRGLVLNTLRAASTNAVHGVELAPDTKGLPLHLAVLSSWSALWCLAAELFGRHYGGGVLKLEPTAAGRLWLVAAAGPDIEWPRTVRAEIIGQYVDREILIRRLGMSPSDVQVLRASAALLAQQRRGLGGLRGLVEGTTNRRAGPA